MVHGYKFTNTLLNHDGVYNFYSNQDVTGSGRWFLSIACGISSYFDLPWINGILCLLYVALTTVIIIDIFNVENKAAIILISGLMAAFPAFTETLFFNFTADGYMLAMLMATLSVRLTLIPEKRINRKILSCILICLCCAIYQSYVSFAMVLALTYFMYGLLQNRYTMKEYFGWIRTQIFIYIFALISYYVIWKLVMYIQGIQPNAYQGISEVGHIGLSSIIVGIINTIKTILFFFLEWNVLEHGWTLYGVLNIFFAVSFIVAMACAVKKSGLFSRKMQLLLFLLSVVALPFASCIWHFASSSVGYRPMMLYCLCLLYIFTIILCEKYFNVKRANLVRILMAVIIYNFALQANISYYYLAQSHEKTHAMATEIMSRIHYIDDGKAEYIAVVGDCGPGNALGQTLEENKIHMLSQLLEKHILSNQEHMVLYLQTMYDMDLEAVSLSELNGISNTKLVKEMGCWPNSDSVVLFDNTVVIKLSGTEESAN